MRRVVPVFVVLVACTGEVDDRSGVLEPVMVPAGTFHEGSLPDGGAARVTGVESASGIALVGQADRVLTGRTTQDAYAIAVRFADMGTGWWVTPVDDLNPTLTDQRDFQVGYDLGYGIPAGLHRLQLAAVDGEGIRGEVFELELCLLDDRVPGALTPCDPTIAPPEVVVSLAWDRLVDLDLVIETPDGQRMSWKEPSSLDAEATQQEGALDDPSVGRLLRDSNGGCLLDGRNAEAAVWPEAPAEGTYSIYVDFFEPCRATNTRYVLSVYRRRERDDGTFALEETERRSGSLLDVQVTGGANSPTFVAGIRLP